MRPLRVVFLLVGLVLLAFVVARVDLTEVGDRLVQMGAVGVAVVLGVYFLVFLSDTASWHLMVTSTRLNGSWLYHLWKVRMVGEAFNAIVPAATMGGEPVKALLLKRRHGIGYRESGASLVMARTTNLLALIVFSAVGLVLMLRSGTLPGAYGVVAGAGLAALTVGVAAFFAVQRWRIASRLAQWLARRRAGGRIERMLVHIQDVDGRFVDFYHRRPGRFAAALALALVNWVLGTLELYYAMYFLGGPVSFAEAWMVETVIQLVRAGTFFIPVSLGASEVGFVIMIGAITGRPGLGLAAAVARRVRELVWIAWGLALGWGLSATPRVAAAEASNPLER